MENCKVLVDFPENLKLSLMNNTWRASLLRAAYIAGLLLTSRVISDAAESTGSTNAKVPGPSTRLGLPGEDFLVAGHPAFVLLPSGAKEANPQPWIFYAPT